MEIRNRKELQIMNEYICCFCENEMSEEQIICCDTYKGKMKLSDFFDVYGYSLVTLDYQYEDC